MTDTTTLSPAAQAVLDAANGMYRYRPDREDTRLAAAAAIRAAVEQVRTDRNLKRHYAATMAEMLVLDRILAIAADLEGR